MKNSLYISLFFIAGIVAGKIFNFNIAFTKLAGKYTLMALMFLIGISIGGDKTILPLIKKIDLQILYVPLFILGGSILGTMTVFMFYRDMGIKDVIALGAGVGYYSLASVYIARLRTNLLGTEALLVNLTREIFTLLLTPVLVKLLGKESPVASGGATSMDTTLAVIVKSSGNEYLMPAIVSGTVLTILVPIIISLIYA